MEENFDNVDEMDQAIADAQKKLIHQALAGKEGYARYLKENQIPVRFDDLAIGESFSFARLGAFDKLKAHKKISATMAIREDGRRIQLYPDWWTGSYRI